MPSRLEKDIKQLYLAKTLGGDVSRLKKFKIKIEDPPRRKHLVRLALRSKCRDGARARRRLRVCTHAANAVGMNPRAALGLQVFLGGSVLADICKDGENYWLSKKEWEERGPDSLSKLAH